MGAGLDKRELLQIRPRLMLCFMVTFGKEEGHDWLWQNISIPIFYLGDMLILKSKFLREASINRKMNFQEVETGNSNEQAHRTLVE